ncbi:hypothetical protein DNTS_005028 [Danionella cerebrum]|uniref:Uncharacterized protein n=1 Tax=Danionella cerebrum TaxID=2873325 RepID=A0A553PMU3_9TELE|nr:hypothetical protein DNTS_005028 [Danionella translucida]
MRVYHVTSDCPCRPRHTQTTAQVCLQFLSHGWTCGLNLLIELPLCRGACWVPAAAVHGGTRRVNGLSVRPAELGFLRGSTTSPGSLSARGIVLCRCVGAIRKRAMRTFPKNRSCEVYSVSASGARAAAGAAPAQEFVTEPIQKSSPSHREPGIKSPVGKRKDCGAWRKWVLRASPLLPFSAAIALTLHFLGSSPLPSVFYLGGSIEFSNLSFSPELTDSSSTQFRLQTQALSHYRALKKRCSPLALSTAVSARAAGPVLRSSLIVTLLNVKQALPSLWPLCGPLKCKARCNQNLAWCEAVRSSSKLTAQLFHPELRGDFEAQTMAPLLPAALVAQSQSHKNSAFVPRLQVSPGAALSHLLQ